MTNLAYREAKHWGSGLFTPGAWKAFSRTCISRILHSPVPARPRPRPGPVGQGLYFPEILGVEVFAVERDLFFGEGELDAERISHRAGVLRDSSPFVTRLSASLFTTTRFSADLPDSRGSAVRIVKALDRGYAGSWIWTSENSSSPTFGE